MERNGKRSLDNDPNFDEEQKIAESFVRKQIIIYGWPRIARWIAKMEQRTERCKRDLGNWRKENPERYRKISREYKQRWRAKQRRERAKKKK